MKKRKREKNFLVWIFSSSIYKEPEMFQPITPLSMWTKVPTIKIMEIERRNTIHTQEIKMSGSISDFEMLNNKCSNSTTEMVKIGKEKLGRKICTETV